jgi:hypothetical protein
MAVLHTIDRTAWELRWARGPWKRSNLYKLGLALQDAGAADSDDAAQDLIWDAVEALGRSEIRTTIREALEHAGVDIPRVLGCLQVIDQRFELERRADDEAKWARATAEFRGSIA